MKHKTIWIRMIASAVVAGLLLGMTTIPQAQAKKKFAYQYGVFLNAEPKDIPKLRNYEKVVIDAQYFSKKQVEKLKKDGHKVYSYINLGSVEKFRPYYKDYEDITLSVYENWEDERWVDVSQKRWQKFIGTTLANRLKKKGVDGYFVDNVDVYYHYHTKKIFNGVTAILKQLKKKGKVIVNGGDAYVRTYGKKYHTLKPILHGVNQETVFSAIDFENDWKLIRNDPENRAYFQDYVKFIKNLKRKVYLLEYTDDAALIKKIKKFCKKHGYNYYITNDPELGV
ncbi:hypothetical protein SAMN02910358_02514 [Lachnospiraceae bacterium XBB1006]|nr:hypothetical protein SAMN02910358_02514 [Lachnospiraceae bacterium XBB1006]